MKPRVALVFTVTVLALLLCSPVWAEDPSPWLATWGTYGTGGGQSKYTFGVAVNDDDEIVRIFPGTASAPGTDDAFFVTDVRLYNPDPVETITVNLSFLDRDADNSGATALPVDIPPRQAVAYNDVLASFFGLSNAAGAIRMCSSSLFYATSRTYNEGGPAGTFGSFCPGLSPEDALDEGILLQVVNDPADSGFRANVGFANPNLTPVDVTVSVYNADTGELIGSKDRELLPRTFSQINNVLKFVGKENLVLTNAAVEFTATSPVLAYTTVIDNTSDDPIFVLPFADEGTPLPAAGSLSVAGDLKALATTSDIVRIFSGTASAPGMDDAFFVTDVRLYNPDPNDTITVYVSFLDRDADNSGATELPVDIPPRQGIAFDDVLASLFGLSNAAGAIRMRSSSLFYATSRTYNEGGPAGTFGSFCPGLAPDDALTQGILLQVANDPADTGFRANVGFANPNLTLVDVTVSVYNADTGEFIGSNDRELLPRTFSQINNVLKFVGQKNLVLTNAAVEFTATSPVLAYTTVIDNTSDDPIFVLPFADTGTAAYPPFEPEITVTLPGGVPLVMVRIPAGTFMMGSPTGESGQGIDEDLHQVTLTRDYYIGKYEVTQAQWQAVMGSNQASAYGEGDDYPRYYVSWDDIAGSGGFIERLNQHLGTSAFRLPTEAEWERAARAGTQTRFGHGDADECDNNCGFCDLHDHYMVWCGNDSGQAEEAGSKLPNGYGLHNMHGNVLEWVQDWYTGSLGTGSQTDPTGPTSGLNRVVRGGCWLCFASHCRSAERRHWSPFARYDLIGFRLARSE